MKKDYPAKLKKLHSIKKVSTDLRHALRQTLIARPETAEGREILATGLLEKFVPLVDYDLIRQMPQNAERVF